MSLQQGADSPATPHMGIYGEHGRVFHVSPELSFDLEANLLAIVRARFPIYIRRVSSFLHQTKTYHATSQTQQQAAAMKVFSTVGAMTACASCASAFVTPSSFSTRVVSSPASTAVRMSDAAAAEAPAAPPAKPAMSKSIPFLTQPENLDGMVGNVGFDPLGFSTIFPAKFMRESELKHGRVAMLAVVGWLVSELVHVPGPAYMSENPVDAMAAVGPGPMLQIFFFCGFLEWKFHNVSGPYVRVCIALPLLLLPS